MTPEDPTKQPQVSDASTDVTDADVVSEHENDSAALRAAAERWWPDIPRASGVEIAWALTRLGLEARIGGPDHIVVVTQTRNASAIVPAHGTVHPAILRSILLTIGVLPEELAEVLAPEKPL